MKAVAFDYLAPRSLDEAFEALSRDDAILMAGGQSLGPMLNLRLVRPRLVVDISRIPALRLMDLRTGSLWIGACVTHSEIEDQRDGFLQAVASGIASRTVRNRGTIGGSLAHADPAGDWPLALAAIGAKLHLRTRKAKRVVPADQFMRGAFTTILEPGELIESIEIPQVDSLTRWGYFKFCRKVGEFPEASAAVVWGASPQMPRVFIGALNTAPAACGSLGPLLTNGDAVGPSDFLHAVQQARPGLDAVETRMHAAALSRAVQQAVAS